MNWVLGFWVLFVATMIGWCWFKKRIKKENKSRIPKGSSGWPLVGETLDFIACGYTTRPVTFMEKRKSLYGKVFKSHILGRPVIVSTDPDVNKFVLQNNGSTFIPFYPKTIAELLGKSSILQMNGNLHKRVHGLIASFLRSPQFKTRITKEIENCVNLSMENWKHNHLVYVQEETRNITFQVLVKVLMSVDPGEDLQFLKKEFEEFMKGLICLPIKLPGTRLHKSLKAKERLMKMVRKIVEEKNLTDEKGAPVVDVVDLLLCDSGEPNDMQQRLPLDFICGNIIEMMIPGDESVRMVMTLAVKYISDCPLALKHLTEENMELKRKKRLSCEDYTWTDYMSLPFTQNVVNETLRMANIINAVWRRALKDVEVKGYLIPKGWCVLASFSSVHFDEENYENPFQFDPWRWQKKEGNIVYNNNNNSFTPFGGGQRLCPGLELSRLEICIFLHHLVTRYRWVAEEDQIIHFPTVKMRRKLPITITSISS